MFYDVFREIKFGEREKLELRRRTVVFFFCILFNKKIGARIFPFLTFCEFI